MVQKLSEKDKVKIEQHLSLIHRNIKLIAIFLVILLVLIFSILFIVAYVQEPCLSNDSQSEIDECYFQAALEKNSVSYCNRISNISLKSSCIQEYAVLFNNSYLCRDIPSVDARESCIEHFN